MFDKILNNIIPKPYEKPVTWEAFSNIKDYYLYCFEEHEDKLTAYLSANQLTGRTSTSMTKGILECVITTNEDRYGNLKATLNNSAYEGLLLTTERKTDFGVFENLNKYNYLKYNDLYSWERIGTSNNINNIIINNNPTNIITITGTGTSPIYFNSTQKAQLKNLFVNNENSTINTPYLLGKRVYSSASSDMGAILTFKNNYLKTGYKISFYYYWVYSGDPNTFSVLLDSTTIYSVNLAATSTSWVYVNKIITGNYTELKLRNSLLMDGGSGNRILYIDNLKIEKV